MPPLKGKVITKKKAVTRVTWETRQTTRGPKTRLVPWREATPSKQTRKTDSASPSKATPSGSGTTSTHIGGFTNEFDGGFDGFEALPRLRLPKKTQNQYLREWASHKDEYLQALLDMEAPPDPRTCNTCGGDGIYRCRDCFRQPIYCTRCCREHHIHIPFHRIEQWTGAFFEDSSLRQAGLEIHLGHGGQACPGGVAVEEHADRMPSFMDDEDWIDEGPTDAPPYLRPPTGSNCLTIIDMSGVHFGQVTYCTCANVKPLHMQLLYAQLFPSTVESPKTAFTFAVLDDFIRDNLECGTSASNYYSKLRRITSSVFPQLVVDRYRDLLRVSRKWRLLKLLKWNGFGHQTDPIKPGGLVLFCPTCPQPGLNVFPAANIDLSDRKYARSFIMDGNFKAEHLKDHRGDDQVWLMDGLGFIVTHQPYHAYLEATQHPLEHSTCNNHRAVNQANANRGHLEATGIGATACARHGCFVPHSVVDFQKGERQVNMDYSLTNALKHNMGGIQRVVHFYDVNCSYMKRLHHRVRDNDHLDFPLGLEIIPGIGIWHVHGHRPHCFARYAPLFIEGAGWIDGEIIETLWSVLNIISGSTRGMSSPHRQELLDFQMNDSNFMKMIRMGKTLGAKLKAARISAIAAQEAFENLDNAVPEAQQSGWKIQEQQALNDRLTDPTAMDIFQIKMNKAPTVRSIELELISTAANTSGGLRGAASWLARGLRIEEATINQKARGPQATDLQRLASARRADQLSSELSKFLSDASAYLGNSIDEIFDEDWEDSEGESDDQDDDSRMPQIAPSALHPRLPLPSNLGRAVCNDLGINALVAQELQLRTGQANNCLQAIRLALADKAVLFRNEVRHASNQPSNTRAWNKVHAVDVSLAKYASIYQKCRQAMVTLRADEEVLQRYQILSDAHLKVTTAVANPDGSGHRNDNLAWFWSIDIPRDTHANNWMSEFYRVNWLRAKAARDRWAEEVNLITSELDWTISFFQTKSHFWEQLEASSKILGAHGRACYAARQAAIYGRLRDQCQLIAEAGK